MTQLSTTLNNDTIKVSDYTYNIDSFKNFKKFMHKSQENMYWGRQWNAVPMTYSDEYKLFSSMQESHKKNQENYKKKDKRYAAIMAMQQMIVLFSFIFIVVVFVVCAYFFLPDLFPSPEDITVRFVSQSIDLIVFLTSCLLFIIVSFSLVGGYIKDNHHLISLYKNNKYLYKDITVLDVQGVKDEAAWKRDYALYDQVVECERYVAEVEKNILNDKEDVDTNNLEDDYNNHISMIVDKDAVVSK